MSQSITAALTANPLTTGRLREQHHPDAAPQGRGLERLGKTGVLSLGVTVHSYSGDLVRFEGRRFATAVSYTHPDAADE